MEGDQITSVKQHFESVAQHFESVTKQLKQHFEWFAQHFEQHFERDLQHFEQHFESVAQHFYMTLEMDIHILYNVCATQSFGQHSPNWNIIRKEKKRAKQVCWSTLSFSRDQNY